MRILLTGAAGLVGRAFLANRAHAHDVTPTYRVMPEHAPPGSRVLDLLDAAAISRTLDAVRPEWVLHPAAMTNVDACERDPDAAWRVNAEATGDLAQACASRGIRLCAVSTDYVFSGERDGGAWKEDDETVPVNAYGRSKLEGEGRVLDADENHLIARTCVVYGSEKANFVTWVAQELSEGRRVRAAEDQWVSPTHAGNLSDMLLSLMAVGERGVWHTAGAAGVSRYEMARLTAKAYGFDETLLTPVKMKDLTWLARRPRWSVLDVTRIAKHVRPLPFEEGVHLLAARAGQSPHKAEDA